MQPRWRRGTWSTRGVEGGRLHSTGELICMFICTFFQSVVLPEITWLSGILVVVNITLSVVLDTIDVCSINSALTVRQPYYINAFIINYYKFIQYIILHQCLHSIITVPSIMLYLCCTFSFIQCIILHQCLQTNIAVPFHLFSLSHAIVLNHT